MATAPYQDAEKSTIIFDDPFRIIGDGSSLVKSEILQKKIIAKESNGETNFSPRTYYQQDGSDSGLDIATALNVCLQHPPYNNEGDDYVNSISLFDTDSNFNDTASCASSMLSCVSDLEEHRSLHATLGNDSCSNYYKKSMSIDIGCNNQSKKNDVRKKAGMYETPVIKSVWKPDTSTLQSGGQLNKLKSCVSGSLSTRERMRCRESAEKPLSNPSSKPTTPPFRSTPIRRTPKPDNLPYTLNSALSLQKVSQRSPSTTRSRTPGTPSEDGRWPSVGNKTLGQSLSAKRGNSVTPDLGSFKLRGQISFESKCSTPAENNANTLPRRKKQKSVEDLRSQVSRSNSNSRENPLVFSSTLVGKKRNMNSTYCIPSRIYTPNKSNYRKLASKTKIYHEIAIQTIMTKQDIETKFAGRLCECVQIDSAELIEKQTQTDLRDVEIECLREEIQKRIVKENELVKTLEDKMQKISTMEKQITKEREEKMSAQRKLNQNTERVIGMLELSRCTTSVENNCDSLMMLESQIQLSGHELNEKQEEIARLRKLCRALQTEIERSLVAQECLMQEKLSIEREATELQDFLQHEKAAMCDALNDSEFEYKTLKKTFSEKEEEIKVLRDECRHLVRLNEQRRQENKLMQSKYTALESKNKEFKLNQSTIITGASIALSALHTRLNNLVEQLCSSYNIAEQDLEDIIFHNGAYANSTSSDDTPECENIAVNESVDENDGSLSPQRNQSFIAAVISAIRNATAPSGKKNRLLNIKSSHTCKEDESDSTEMLDSETEPCLMMDNVLEDVIIPDSHSHNMVSSTGVAVPQLDLPTDFTCAGDESLQNLSQAITNRQQIESQINVTTINTINHLSDDPVGSLCEEVSFYESLQEAVSNAEYSSTQTLVDEVIEVDNLVTKLLKVLRLIQMENDVCIQQLIVDKNKLQQNKEDMLEKCKDLQDINIKLRDELVDATQELMLKSTDLSSAKADIQRHRNEIDRLNEDVCQLSTLCTQNNAKFESLEQEFTLEGILRLLRKWNEQGYFLKTDIKDYIASIYFEEPMKLDGNREFHHEHLNVNLNESFIKKICHQSKIIEKALTVLKNLQSIVQDNSTLQQLERDLESVSIQSTLNMFALCSSNEVSLPTSSSEDIVNANSSQVSLEGFTCSPSINHNLNSSV